jgi:hypothetical protein
LYPCATSSSWAGWVLLWGPDLLPTRPEVGLNARAGGDCHGANRGLEEQTSEIGDFAERGRRILLGWDGGRYSQRGRSRLEQAGHPPSAHAAVFTGRCAPGVTPVSHLGFRSPLLRCGFICRLGIPLRRFLPLY